MNKHSLIALIFGIYSSIATAIAQTDALEISGAWVREAPPTSQVLAAYMQIDNKGAEDVSVVAASSPQFDSVEMHRTEIVDGVARMIAQERLVVPAGGSVTLRPGDLHLMLIQSLKPLHRGDQVEIDLKLSNGETLRVQAEVRPGMDEGMGEGMDHSHHHH